MTRLGDQPGQLRLVLAGFFSREYKTKDTNNNNNNILLQHNSAKEHKRQQTHIINMAVQQ